MPALAQNRSIGPKLASTSSISRRLESSLATSTCKAWPPILFGNCRCCLEVDIGHDDGGRSLQGEPSGQPGSDAASGAGDDDDLARILAWFSQS